MNRRQIIKNNVIENIKKDMSEFGIPEFELKDRISVILDVDQFNKKEDESVWLQDRGKAPFVCEVYFDNVFICDLHEQDTHTRLILKYFKGFLKAYNAKRVRINKAMYAIDDELEKQAKKDAKDKQKKDLASLPERSPEEKASKEIVKEIIEEKQK